MFLRVCFLPLILVEKNVVKFRALEAAIQAGPILDSKGMHVIFQKKGEKGQNI